MRYQEYERRRRVLEQQLQADLDLVRAAHAIKIKSLESLWLASPAEEQLAAAPSRVEEPAEPPPSETASVPSETVLEASETSQLEAAPRETVLMHEPPPEAPAPPLPAEKPAPALPRGETAKDLRSILPDLPELFEKEDVYRLLGYKPSRATLYRAVSSLRRENKIDIERYSLGGKRTRYRKVREG